MSKLPSWIQTRILCIDTAGSMFDARAWVLIPLANYVPDSNIEIYWNDLSQWDKNGEGERLKVELIVDSKYDWILLSWEKVMRIKKNDSQVWERKGKRERGRVRGERGRGRDSSRKFEWTIFTEKSSKITFSEGKIRGRERDKEPENEPLFEWVCVREWERETKRLNVRERERAILCKGVKVCKIGR